MATVDASSAPAGAVLSGGNPAAKPPARSPWLLPALILVGMYWGGRLAIGLSVPGSFTNFMFLFWAPMILGVATIVWLLFLSRLSWLDRGWSLLCLIGGGAAAAVLADHSMLFGLVMYALPVAVTALVGGLALTRGGAHWPGRAALLALVFAGWGYYTLIRLDGVEGSLTPQFSWRWQETTEDRYLAELKPTTSRAVELVPAATDWPAFRGPQRDGIVRGVQISDDWQSNPPRELWRVPVGPNWSSIAVVGHYGFTQEQRGKHEAVVCFDLNSGAVAWTHLDPVRFSEVVAGPGPRATPTFHEGKLYTQGGGGLVNCLDASTGKKLWEFDVAAKLAVKPPQWGFSSSPLVAGDVVICYAGAKGKALVALDRSTGELAWSGGEGVHSYSSPHLWSLDGEDQVLFVSDFGLQSFDPASGRVVWQHPWELDGIFRVVQPLITRDHGILLGTGMGHGTRQLNIESAATESGWKVTEGWTSKDLKPYFNDVVEHEGCLYGFDGDIFTCIDLESGKRNWKKGRYGNGQVLLVADSGLLIVVTETTGEIVLLEANPDEHVELARLQAVTGKTWNHPVLAGNKLLVRNGEEMVCYELALEDPAAGE